MGRANGEKQESLVPIVASSPPRELPDVKSVAPLYIPAASDVCHAPMNPGIGHILGAGGRCLTKRLAGTT